MIIIRLDDVELVVSMSVAYRSFLFSSNGQVLLLFNFYLKYVTDNLVVMSWRRLYSDNTEYSILDDTVDTILVKIKIMHGLTFINWPGSRVYFFREMRKPKNLFSTHRVEDGIFISVKLTARLLFPNLPAPRDNQMDAPLDLSKHAISWRQFAINKFC